MATRHIWNQITNWDVIIDYTILLLGCSHCMSNLHFVSISKRVVHNGGDNQVINYLILKMTNYDTLITRYFKIKTRNSEIWINTVISIVNQDGAFKLRLLASIL